MGLAIREICKVCKGEHCKVHVNMKILNQPAHLQKICFSVPVSRALGKREYLMIIEG